MNETIREKQSKLTKNIIVNSFLDLVESKSSLNIKITDVCRSAEISRGTFYNHFIDIDDLIDYINSWYVEMLKPHLVYLFSIEKPDRQVSLSILSDFMKLLSNHPKYCNVILCSEHGKCAMKKVQKLFHEQYKCWLEKFHPDVNVDEALYSLAAATGGGLSVLRKWINDGFKETPEDMLNYFPKLKDIHRPQK